MNLAIISNKLCDSYAGGLITDCYRDYFRKKDASGYKRFPENKMQAAADIWWFVCFGFLSRVRN